MGCASLGSGGESRSRQSSWISQVRTTTPVKTSLQAGCLHNVILRRQSHTHTHSMNRFPSRDTRAKPKTANSPIYSSRARASSTLSLLQPAQLHARASSVVRKVLGARPPLKDPTVFVDPAGRTSCDKARPSADLTGPARPRRNTTICSITCTAKSKPLAASQHNNATCPAAPGGPASGPTFQLDLPVNSLLFSPNLSSEDDQRDMQSPVSTTSERPVISKDSPDMYDSGYASGQSSHAGLASTAPNASPVATRTPKMLGKTMPTPMTPGSMRLSPSVTRSMMPMPILNLPPLPPTPSHTHVLPRTRSFQPGEMRHVKKAMPALMRHGTSNMHMEHPQEDDDDDDGSTDSDSSDAEETNPAGESSPEARDSIDESIDESGEQSSGEDTSYFDAREAHTPAPSDEVASSNALGLATPRASQQGRVLVEASALGLQITPGPSTIGGSPWTMVDTTPGIDRTTASQQQTSRLDYFSHPVASVRQVFKSPHRTPRVSELLSMGSASRVNVSTPRAAPLSPPSSIAARRARASTVLRGTDGESPRPGLYQQASQSMMNLSSPVAEGIAPSPFTSMRSPLLTPREGLPAIAGTPGTPTAPMPTPLMRRNSMPTMIRHPPAYKELYPSLPREEEGKEKLPPYSCGIHIEAMMPRKMEFTAPGVVAKDRAWKKQYVVLHGTSLMIYKHDIRKQPIGGKIKGKERYEGVVTEDEVDLDSPTVHLPGHESNTPRPPLKVTTARRASVPSRNSSTGTPDNSSRSSLLSRFHGNSSRVVIPSSPEPSTSDDKTSSSQSTVSVDTNSSSSSRRWSHNQAAGSSFASSLPHFNGPFSTPNALVRHYTLQKSESGLGSDYYKKRNVIRVRCEGEQFLLQADSVMQVVDWIEALQAGTNVALDLDERPMTKPPPFPRRRRRRRRPTDTTGPGAPGAPANAASENTSANN